MKKAPATKYLLSYSCLDINRNLGIFDTEETALDFIETLCQETDWADDASEDCFFIEPILVDPDPKLVRFWDYDYGTSYNEFEKAN